MAVVALAAQRSTSSLTLSSLAWTDVETATVTGTGNAVEIKANMNGVDPSQVQTRITIDGTELTESDSVGGSLIVVIESLSLGSHTIKFQAFAFNGSQVATYRFLTVYDLAVL